MLRPPARAAGLVSAVSLAAAAMLGAALTGCPAGSGGDSSATSIVQGSTLTAIQERNKLIVGIEPTFWPMEYKDASGKLVGLDIDLVGELARALDVEVEYAEMKFDGIIPALNGRKIDIAVSGITATLERARMVAFSRPYFMTGLCLLIRKDSDIQSFEDLNRPDVRLALKKGTTGFLVATKRFPKAKQAIFDEEAACALEVVQGRADAFVYDRLSIYKHHTQHPDATRVNLEPFTYEPYAIMLRQGEPDLARYLDQFIDTLEREGRLGDITEKHLGRLSGR